MIKLIIELIVCKKKKTTKSMKSNNWLQEILKNSQLLEINYVFLYYKIYNWKKL